MFKLREKYEKWRFIFAAVLILLSTSAQAVEEVTLQLRWLHQFQFAGYYAAKEKGFYQDVGLDVTLVAGGPGKVAVEEVLSGQSEYGVANHEILLNRLLGKPLVALAAIFQHSPAVFMALQASGIYSPHDLVGRKVMTIGGNPDAGLVSMLLSEGLDADQVEILNSTFDINDLVDGKTDLFNTYLTNEPFLMEQMGIPYTILNPTKYGIDFYSDILFTTEAEIKHHPGRVKKFREASLQGWIYAMEHPEEIIDVILAKYNTNKTREHLQFEANAMRPLILPEIVQMGHISPHRWKLMIAAFKNVGVIEDERNLEGLIYNPARLLQEQQAFTVKMLLTVFTVIIVCGSLLWNVSLRRRVTIRTLELASTQQQLEKQYMTLEKLSVTDHLTKLFNRSMLDKALLREVARAERYDQDFGVVMLDLDHFKDVNDTHGHLVGDDVLVVIAKLMKKHTRTNDIVGRWGGEEFFIICPETNCDGVVALAEKLRERIANYDFPVIGQMTSSFGVTMYQPGDNGNTIVARADKALYIAKANGRNCTKRL